MRKGPAGCIELPTQPYRVWQKIFRPLPQYKGEVHSEKKKSLTVSTTASELRLLDTTCLQSLDSSPGDR